jgi:uncharacterized protein (DUF305 family)
MKRQRLILAILAVLLTLGAAPAAFADGPIEGRAGRAEVRFMEGMSDHHQMALDMANDCLKKAKTESVLKMCQDIIAAQTPEIKQMHDWLLAWYKVEYKTMPMPAMEGMMQATAEAMPGMDATADMGMPMGTAEAGIMAGGDPAGMMGMMAGFNRLQGREYELAFLESMIDHHDDAVHMSQRILKTAQHKDLRTFAEKIIKDQTAEIQTMESMITELNK